MTEQKPPIWSIKAPCHQSTRSQGFQDGPIFIKEKYDAEINITNFDSSSEVNKNKNLCIGYELLYNKIIDQRHNNQETRILLIGGDHTVSVPSISAVQDSLLKANSTGEFYSDLMLVYISSSPDLYTYETSPEKNLTDLVMTSLLGALEYSISPQKLALKTDQIIYLGLQKNNTYDQVNELGIMNYTTDKIKLLGPEIVLANMLEIIQDKLVYLSIDMKAFDKQEAPSTEPQTNSGLKLQDIQLILKGLANNIIALDITEYNPRLGTARDSAQTANLAKQCIVHALGVKQQRLNIFNEDSQFLIYRPLDQEDQENLESPENHELDIGWYLLRGLTMTQKEELLSKIPDDKIINIEIDGEDYLVTKTSINEQSEKSYYCANSIYDLALYPEEKVEMGFELIY